MDQITRTPEPPQQRTETSRSPRGEELQQASNLFAELLGKERKDTKSTKTDRDKTKDDDLGDSEFAEAESGAVQTGALPYGIHLPGDRGQSSHQDQSQNRFIDAMEFSNSDTKPLDATSGEQVELPRYLGPPTRVGDTDSQFESLIRSELNAGEASVSPQTLPTPGELMLQAFNTTRIETPPATRIDPTPQANIDAIRELGEQIADRILVSRPESAGPQEMLIQLKDSALAGTEVRMSHNGERLEITLVTDNATSFHLLAARQTDLQAKLGDGVVVQLSFDPEGMISQQRMDRPIAAESSQQSGDRNRERDSDDRRRDQRRDQPQDRDS